MMERRRREAHPRNVFAEIFLTVLISGFLISLNAVALGAKT